MRCSISTIRKSVKDFGDTKDLSVETSKLILSTIERKSEELKVQSVIQKDEGSPQRAELNHSQDQQNSTPQIHSRSERQQ